LQCAACHAWSGDGGALLQREAPSIHPASALEIAEAVRAGPGNMPAFGRAALDDRQLQSLVRYVRYLDHPDDRGGAPLWHLGPLAEGAVAVFVGLALLVVAVRWIGSRS
jgi:ubiquinol-cytochrome c reductase cytochrome c subunit